MFCFFLELSFPSTVKLSNEEPSLAMSKILLNSASLLVQCSPIPHEQWLISLKNSREKRGLFSEDCSHEEFTSQGFSPTEMIYLGNNISGHYYNQLHTLFCLL